MNPRRKAWTFSLFGAVSLVVLGGALALGAPKQESANLFGDVVAELKRTEGCLGVELVQTASGKQAVFAWFDGKPAVLRFYSSQTHRAAMDQFFPDRPPHKPLADVADDVGPILTIASITPQATPNPDLGGLPFSQISIELLTPLPGGLDFGGTFAPKGAKAKGKPHASLER